MRTTKSVLKLPPTKRDRFLLQISVRRGLRYFDEFPALSMATSAFLESFYKHDIRKCDQDEHQEHSRYNSLTCLLSKVYLCRICDHTFQTSEMINTMENVKEKFSSFRENLYLKPS